MVGMKFCLLFRCLIKKIKPCDCTPANPPVPAGSQLAAGWVPKALRNISDNTQILKAHPEDMLDAHNPAWGPPESSHYWGDAAPDDRFNYRAKLQGSRPR